MASTAIRLAVLANASQAKRELNSVSQSTSKFGQTIKRAAAVGVAVAGAAITKFGIDSVKAASNAQQSLGATETVFGKFSKSVVKDSNKAATQFGLSANEYRENANLIGSLFKNQGVSLDQLGGKTKDMISKASDLAATFGGTTADAVGALGAAFKGEFDSLEKYGISLKQSTVNAEAAKVAQQKYGKALEDLTPAQQAAAKQQATSALIQKQSADSAGAFAKESNTLAHQQQVLGAQFENVKVMVGNFLLPILTKAFSYVSTTVIPAVRKFVNEMKNGEGAGGTFAAALKKVWDALKKTYEFLTPVFNFMKNNKSVVATFAGVILTLAAAVKVWRTAQLALNLALAANPIGLVIVAIAALAAGLVYAYKKSETFRNIVDGAMKLAGAAIRGLWNNVAQPVFQFIVRAIARVIETFADMVGALSHVPGFGWADEAADKMHAAAGGANDLADKIKKIPETKVITISVNMNAYDKNLLDEAGGNGGKTPTDGLLASGGKTPKSKNKFGLTGILDGLFNGPARSIGDIESDVVSDIDTLMASITDHYTKKGETASANIAARFEKKRKELREKIKKAEKTEGKQDEKDLQTKLDALDGKEKKAINAAIARQNAKAKAAKAAARVITKALQENARAQDIANEKIAVATDALNALKDEAASTMQALKDEAASALQAMRDEVASFISNIKDSFVQFGNVVGLGVRDVLDAVTGEVVGTKVTITDLLADMRKKVADAQKFSNIVAGLAASGLNQTTINQLLEAGVENGMATAEAIAEGGTAAINEINSLTTDLNTAGEVLGTTLAATFYDAGIANAQAYWDAAIATKQQYYDAGIASGQAVVDGLINHPVTGLLALQAEGARLMTNLGTVLGDTGARENRGAGNRAGQGFLEGLKDQEDNIERVARRLAKKLAKAVAEELGIKSPSRVFRDLGRDTARGLILGLDDVNVARAGAVMGRDLASGFGSPLSAVSAFNASASSTGTIQITFTAEQLDAMQRGRAIQADLDAWKRVGGRAVA